MLHVSQLQAQRTVVAEARKHFTEETIPYHARYAGFNFPDFDAVADTVEKLICSLQSHAKLQEKYTTSTTFIEAVAVLARENQLRAELKRQQSLAVPSSRMALQQLQEEVQQLPRRFCDTIGSRRLLRVCDIY